jgi:transposase
MDGHSLRKTFKYKLQPTATQERELERVLGLCRRLYNVALEQRITAWQRCQVSISRYEQEAELKGIRADFPEYAAIHSHLLQDVLARLDKTYQAFVRRLQRGERAGFPRFRVAIASTASPSRSTATARDWITALLSSPRSGASVSTGPGQSMARPRPSR